MTLFIQNIPEDATEIDIRNFVSPALNKLGFIRTGKILKIEIFNSLNKATGEIQYHSVVLCQFRKNPSSSHKKITYKAF